MSINIQRGAGGGGAGGPSQANQAALEAETNEDTYAPPDLLKHNPGMAKAWVKFDRAGTVNASQNITSITDTGAGDWTVTIATDFSSVNYAVIVTYRADDGNLERWFCTGAQAAGTIQILTDDHNGDIADPQSADDMHAAMFGDQ